MDQRVLDVAAESCIPESHDVWLAPGQSIGVAYVDTLDQLPTFTPARLENLQVLFYLRHARILHIAEAAELAKAKFMPIVVSIFLTPATVRENIVD